MALDMTPEQKEVGKGNFNRAVGKLAEDDQAAQARGITRRRFMQGLIAASATLPVSAAAYYGYRNHGFPNTMRPVKAALIGTGDEGGVLVGYHNPQFVEFIAVCDVRPYNKRRIFTGEASGPRTGLNHHYGADCRRNIREFDDWRRMLRDVPDIEMVVIALPLHLHYQATIDSLDAGKHVLCEKLMAWNIRQCKDMIAKADQTRKLLSIGHQRHYSMLYAHANELVTSGILGDIKHIRALWHRNCARPNTNPQTRTERPLLDPWWPIIPPEDRAHLTGSRLNDLNYRSIEELVRWRLYQRTGGGLMAELGSHQLDACSIFLGKKRPLSVTAVGGTHFFGVGQHPYDREVEDHVYCIYEFPGPQYDRNNRTRKNDIVTVTYSSITTNDFENYGECVMGTKGTLVVEKEETAMLWGGPLPGGGAPRSTEVTVNTTGSAPVLDASATASPSERRAQATGQTALGAAAPSKGYREEMEHLAYCIRMQGQGMQRDEAELKPRCDGRSAMADAIVALAANKAMKHQQRVAFDDRWFDPASAEVPDEA
jgi:predicted dehydrogenase